MTVISIRRKRADPIKLSNDDDSEGIKNRDEQYTSQEQ